MQQEFKFKTTLNCSNCVAKVQTSLDETKAIKKWSVDTNHPDKILTVQATDITAEEIISLITAKGFEAKQV